MKTLINRFQKAATDEQGRALPYVVAWFFGVPISILFLVWLFSHHH